MDIVAMLMAHQWIIPLISIVLLIIGITSENDAFVGITGLSFIIICGYGWIMNIVKFAAIMNNHVTGTTIIRILGIPLFPIGIFMGYI